MIFAGLKAKIYAVFGVLLGIGFLAFKILLAKNSSKAKKIQELQTKVKVAKIKAEADVVSAKFGARQREKVKVVNSVEGRLDQIDAARQENGESKGKGKGEKDEDVKWTTVSK